MSGMTQCQLQTLNQCAFQLQTRTKSSVLTPTAHTMPAMQLLSPCQRAFQLLTHTNSCVQMIGFTCGMGDLLLTAEHEAGRAKRLEAAESIAILTGAALADVKLPEAAVTAAAPGSALLRASEHAVRTALRPRYRQNARMGLVHDQRCSGALNPCASGGACLASVGGL